MEHEEQTYEMKGGRVLTGADLEALADEAERGYDPAQISRSPGRPGRPRMGAAPAVVLPVRLHRQLDEAVKRQAAIERTSVSELVRQAVKLYLETDTSAPAFASSADIERLADEAEAGYPVPAISRKPRARPRAEVVPVRVPPELKVALESRAEAESTSVSEIVRAALRGILDDPDLDPPPAAPSESRRRSTTKALPPGAPPRSRLRGPTEADTCRDYVVPRLKEAGWSEDQIIEQYRITDGRVIKVGSKHRRADALRADYVLEYRPGVPIAVVEAKREYSTPDQGMQEAKNYAQLLDVPFAYSTNGVSIVEDDRNTGIERENMPAFPSPDMLWARYREWKGIRSEAASEGLLFPFNRGLHNADGTVKEPRYYQRVAINRAVEAILGGRKRLLLTMATGTGKTFVSMQIVWKLWNSGWVHGRRPRILYLADRNVLVDQPIEREFKPAFGADAGSPIWKLRGVPKAGREIYFGLYQQLADGGAEPNGMFRQFAPNFFDLVIVDECHRGSARSESSWRAILNHFHDATQLGMTATPKRDETADTYAYFGGAPIFQYSLAQGIEDGFLAPYRVRRVVLSPDAHGWSPDQGQLDLFGKEIPAGLYTTKDFERVVSLLSRTEAAAKHLTNYLRGTDRFAKTIVFCANQVHAGQMRRALHNANSDLTPQHPDYVVRIVSDEKKVGQGHLSRFTDTDSQFPVIATTSELLSTGVDAPTVQNIVLFRPIGSMALFKQMIGRGTRLFPDDDKLSFDIIDYSGASVLFSDPEFDGPPEQVVREEIDDEGSIVEDAVIEKPKLLVEPPPEDREADVDPDDLPEPRAKYYVDGVEVYVTAEAAYELNPQTNRLRLVEYRDLVTQTVRSLFPSANELRAKWAKRVSRHEVVEALAARGIDADEIAARTGLADADPIDVLVHLAWNQPLATRVDRARRVRKEHADFFAAFQPAAREVLDFLLDKYAEYGISELEDPAVLQVQPFSNLGTPVEIARRFGSVADLRDAQAKLGELVYVA